MSKFNPKAVSDRDTVNYMGEKARKYDKRYELINILLTSFVESQYYEGAGKITDRLIEAVKSDPLFSAKAAIFARNEFGMRSITHIVGAEVSNLVKKEKWVSHFVNKVVFRVDDMTEILSYHLAKYGKPIPNSLKRGLASAFARFDAYQLAKYRGEGKKVSLIDVVNLVHPKPTQKNEQALKELVAGTLKSKDTWEAKLTEAGKSEDKEKAKEEAWDELINSGKLGYFAALRNLRNISKQAPHLIPKIAELLKDPVAICRSKVFPFRFISAMEALEGELKSKSISFEKDESFDFMQILNDAVTVSCQNLPEYDGKTAILIDNSGSMRGDSGGHSLISAKSNATTSNIANLFGAMYWLKAQNTYVGVFGDQLIKPTMDRSKTLLENYKIVNRAGSKVGSSTEQGIFTFFENCIHEKVRDIKRIFVFSDMQIGNGCTFYDTKGRKAHNFMQIFKDFMRMSPDTRVYTIDLRSYGTTVFDDRVIKMSGFSDKLFEIVDILEQDKNALIKKIEAIEL